MWLSRRQTAYMAYRYPMMDHGSDRMSMARRISWHQHDNLSMSYYRSCQ